MQVKSLTGYLGTRITWKVHWLTKMLSWNLTKGGLFLSLGIFRLLILSLLLYSQRFSRYVLRPSSGVSCRNREPAQNLEVNPCFNYLIINLFFKIVPLVVHTFSSIGVGVLAFHWSKRHPQQIWYHHINFRPMRFLTHSRISSLWFSKRNCYYCRDAFQRH